jgi:hypothetical protein
MLIMVYRIFKPVRLNKNMKPRHIPPRWRMSI